MNVDYPRLAGLDLFSGIGGITIALQEWVRPVAYCENNKYAQAVLLSRMDDGQLPTAPIWDDVITLGAANLPEDIDIIYGGFPCQDISIAGRGAGLEGKRSGLFYEVARLVGEIRPAFVFLENVPAITVRGLGDVVGEMARLRYDCRWGILSAADMGAPHRRDRWWMLAHAQGRKNVERRAGSVGETSARRKSIDATPLAYTHSRRRSKDDVRAGRNAVGCSGATDRRSRRLAVETIGVRT